MEMDKNNYRSYLLRLWRVMGEDESQVRASLENVMTSEVHHFATLEALVEYLETSLKNSNKRRVVFEIDKK
jgi:hypothetical protein